ncbi:hypothetical protein MIND_00390400 [Mycena indigotica]|uniref:Uncharacterized protein n=1 Tax=Mycena indigotica TaxID=2126181 RepID=A0A8H6W900_9AGAR|nr:uncharacterized protein MIND_00390400 [Mycena indigotica]KAF7310169.1 hypothetical protein MIND_00390400 [Mycena indigotica]
MLATDQRPPLPTMPSTPGPDVPGGYPRTSVVFAGNRWDRPANSDASGGLGSYFYLPKGVASYFHHPPGLSTTASVRGSASAPGTPAEMGGVGQLSAPRTPYPLNTDGSVASDISTRAIASESAKASTCGPMTPVPVPVAEEIVSPPASDSGATQNTLATEDRPVEQSHPQQPAEPQPAPLPAAPAPLPAEPIPAVAPLAGLAAFAHKPAPVDASANANTAPPLNAHPSPPSSPASNNTSPHGSPSTAPSSESPASPLARWAAVDDKTSPSHATPGLLGRFASVRRGHRKTASESAPPSAFGALSRTPRMPSRDITGDGKEAAEKPRRTRSLMRALRGEATVLAGRVTRDAGRVAAGRRMVREA